jgi:hypothetical protein
MGENPPSYILLSGILVSVTGAERKQTFGHSVIPVPDGAPMNTILNHMRSAYWSAHP